MRRLPPLNALKAFEATARLSSVTAAAEELSVSHSAVSQHIRQLEAYFGQKLFDRPGRRVRPTPAATALLEDVQASFDRVTRACERLARRGISPITVNTTPTFAMRWLMPRINTFQRHHPKLELRIETSASEAVAHVDLASDLIVRSEFVSRRGYLCRPLLNDRATAVMAPALHERTNVTSPRDLLEMNLLHTRSNPELWTRWFSLCGVSDLEAQRGPFFHDVSIAVQAALNGLGVALVPLIFVSDELAAGKLIAPLPEKVITGAGFHALFRECAAHERGMRELLRWLETESGAQLLPSLLDTLQT